MLFGEADILKLYGRFRRINVSKSELLSLDEISSLGHDISDNPLLERVFNTLVEPGQSGVSFERLVAYLSRIASPNEEDKLRVIFDVYDVNRDGFISNGDLFKTVRMMCGDNLSRTQLQQLTDRTIRDFDTIDYDGKISFDEFRAGIEATKIKLQNQLNLDW